MQSKGRLTYIFDSAGGKWVPWAGTAAAFGGVTLFNSNGVAIGVSSADATQTVLTTAPTLIITALQYLASNTSATDARIAAFVVDGDATPNAIASGARSAMVSSRGYGFNGTTWDRLRALGNNADNLNPVTVGSQNVLGSGYVYSDAGVEWNRQRSLLGNSDAQSSTTLGITGTVSRLQAYNGASFDRLRSAGNASDAVATTALGVLQIGALAYGFNGTTFDRLRSFAATADALAAPTLGLQGTLNIAQLFNGASFDRVRSASAATQSAAPKVGITAVAMVGGWTLTNAPAANTQATATQAAGGAAIRHVLTAINATLNAVAAITAPLTICVRDGASGAGAILWQDRMTAPAGVDSRIVLSGLAIVGSANTAMTVEFTAAPGALNFETLNATGYAAS